MYGGRGEDHSGFRQGNLSHRDCLEDLDKDGMILLKWWNWRGEGEWIG